MRVSARNRFLTILLLHSFALLATAQKPSPSSTGNFDGPAELPRVQVRSSLAETPTPGKTRLVHAGDNLEQAITQAACGDTIKLEAGAVFSGRFVLPSKNCDDAHWIVIRTSAPDSALPPEGSRLTPCYAGVASLPARPAYPCPTAKNVLARIEFPGKGTGPIEFASGANHYRLMGLEITRSATEGTIYNLALVEPKSTASNLVFDRVWVHGTAQSETTRGLELGGSTNVAVVDSYFSDFHCIAAAGACTDAQAIAGGTGPNPMGPYKVENNFLEAAAEVILLGGAGGVGPPTDIEIRRNHFFRPLTWMKDDPGFVGSADGHPFIVKNLFELKNGQRVLFENNVLENCWGGFSQQGFGIVLTPKNQNGNCPECKVLDVTIRNILIRNVASGFQIANIPEGPKPPARDGGRYSIHNVLVENLDFERFHGGGALFQINFNTVPLHDIAIDHVTVLGGKRLFTIGARPAPMKITNFSFTNNLIGARLLIDSPGSASDNCSFRADALGPTGVLESCFSDAKFAGNVIVGAGGKWPDKNFSVKNLSDVGFVAADKERVQNHRLGSDSRYKKAGTDQKDVGANVDAIEAATKDAL